MIKSRLFYRHLCWGTLALAVLMRLIPLMAQGLWYDELYSVKMGTFSLAEINYLVRFDTHPPLFYQLIHVAMRSAQALGQPFVSTSWLRLVSVVPSFLTCLILWRWASEAGGRRVGWFALAVAAVSPGLCFYAQELRNYSLVIMFIALAGWRAMCLRREITIRNGLLFAAATLGHLYTHNLSLLILIGNAFYLWIVPLLVRRPPGVPQRAIVYASLLLIAMVQWPQLQRARVQFAERYDPVLDQRPEAQWPELVTVMFNEFATGPINSENYRTPLGMLAICGLVTFAVMLLRNVRMGPSASPGGYAPGVHFRYALFMLLFYLWTSGLLTMFQVGKFFSSGRLVFLALPFWIMLVVLLIESVIPFRRRLMARVILLGIELSCALVALDSRIENRSDFLFLKVYNASLSSLKKLYDRTFYLNDPELAPWISHPHTSLHIEALRSASKPNEADGNRIRIISLNSSDNRLLRDDDLIETMLTHYWCESHKYPVELLRAMRVYAFPATLWNDYRSTLQQARVELLRPIVRERNRLVLPAWCHEFENARGLDFPEYDGKQGTRWTIAPRVQIYFRGPEQPGHYRVRASFWRPQPFPTPQFTVEYRFGPQAPWEEKKVGTGLVLLEGEVTTSHPHEPVMLDLLTDCFEFRHFVDKESKDRRKLSMLFMHLEMAPTP